jgi:hypothetical protein
LGMASPCHGWKPVRVSAVRPRVSLALPPYLPYPNSCQGTNLHQQRRGAKANELYNVGIDVSIDRLDVAIRPGGRAFVSPTARLAGMSWSLGCREVRSPRSAGTAAPPLDSTMKSSPCRRGAPSAIGSVSGPSLGRPPTSRMRRFRTFPALVRPGWSGGPGDSA